MSTSAWNPPPDQSGGPWHGEPYGGSAVPGDFGLPPTALPEPLISPDYAGWWSRGVTIITRGWRPLVALQAAGLVLTVE